MSLNVTNWHKTALTVRVRISILLVFVLLCALARAAFDPAFQEANWQQVNLYFASQSDCINYPLNGAIPTGGDASTAFCTPGTCSSPPYTISSCLVANPIHLLSKTIQTFPNTTWIAAWYFSNTTDQCNQSTLNFLQISQNNTCINSLTKSSYQTYTVPDNSSVYLLAQKIACPIATNFSTTSFLANRCYSNRSSYVYWQYTYQNISTTPPEVIEPVAPVNTPSPPEVIEPVAPVNIPSPPFLVIQCTSQPPSNGNFVCDESSGIWVTNSSVEVSQISIYGSTEIGGNFSTTSISFPSPTLIPLSSSSSSSPLLVVSGCTDILGSTITITLDQSDLDKILSSNSQLSSTLVSQSASCDPSSLSNLQIVVNAPKSCHKVSSSRNSAGSQAIFSVIFTVNSNSCKIWWIVLICVLGTVLIIVLVFLLLATFHPTVKAKIRPFWLRRTQATPF